MDRGHAEEAEGPEWDAQDSHSRSDGSGFGLPSAQAPRATPAALPRSDRAPASRLCVLKPPVRRHHRLHHLGTVALWLSPSPDGAT